MILQRVAESREAVKQGMDTTVEVVRSVCRRARESRPYIRVGLTVGGGLVGLFLGKRMMHALMGRHGTVPLPASAPAASGAGQALWWLLVQVLSSLLLPWVRERLQAPVLSDSLKRMHPSRIFFRWLGLEK